MSGGRKNNYKAMNQRNSYKKYNYSAKFTISHNF